MRMSRLNMSVIAALVVGLVTLLVFVLSGRNSGAAKDALREDRILAASLSKPDKRCTSARTYDLVKQELFRSAVELRGSDQAAFDRLSAYSSARMERPLVRRHDKELGTIRCSGRLSLDLPPGVAVIGGRRTLTANVDYILQPAADGSGDVVMLEGDAPITVPLATLARTGQVAGIAMDRDRSITIAQQSGDMVPEAPAKATSPPAPARERTSDAPGAKPRPTPPVRRVAERIDRKTSPAKAADKPTAGKPPAVAARPSFNCRYARTRGEIAICQDGGLASLDRQMASQYYRAIASADAQQRQRLRSTRDAFLRTRDRCRDESCIAARYRERMREIDEIRN